MDPAADKDGILREFPLFADLSDDERAFIAGRVSLVDYSKGALIYEEGSAPGSLHGVVSGRVMIYTRDVHGERTILEYLHRGKYFGIISLLTGEPHSVSAQALNDCVLLEIPRQGFDEILEKIPRVAVDLSRTLSRRLKRKDVHQKIIFESTALSVISSHPHAGKTVYALNLALSLAKETRKSVIVMDIVPAGGEHTLPGRLNAQAVPVCDLSVFEYGTFESLRSVIAHSEFGVDLICFHYRQEDQLFIKRLVGILSLLVNDYHYIILDVPSVEDQQVFDVLHQSDEVHILTGPDQAGLKRTGALASRLDSECIFPGDKVRIIINQYKPSSFSYQDTVELLGADVYATLPRIDFDLSDRLVLEEPGCEYSRALRRISREVGDRLVGLVLGIGVAYGLCHVGVLKVIEEEHIPVDIIVGSSIGALIASLWATGASSEQILSITAEFKAPRHIWGLIDLTFPSLGFIKGKRLRQFLTRHLGNKTFQDTRLPLKIIASDVKRKEPRIFDQGPLVDAILASCAMPGVFAPFKFKEEMLFDGGVVNPLPTEPLLKMGVKKIIAVNVTPSRQDIIRQYEKIKRDIPGNREGRPLPKRRMGFVEYLKNRFQNNILDIIFSSIEMLQSEVVQAEARLADVVLHPDTSGLFWLELHRAREFARRGEEEARRHLDAIWRVVNE